LQNREARQSAPSGTEIPFKNHWAALCVAREMASKKSKSFIVEHLYYQIRTYFERD